MEYIYLDCLGGVTVMCVTAVSGGLRFDSRVRSKYDIRIFSDKRLLFMFRRVATTVFLNHHFTSVK